MVAVGQYSAAMFALTLVLVYFTWGQIFALFPATAGDYFGTKHATSNYAVLYTAKGVASIIGGWFGAFLYERSGSWTIGFYGSAAMALVAAAHGRGTARVARIQPRGGAGAGGGQVVGTPVEQLADELTSGVRRAAARSPCRPGGGADFDLAAAYAVEAELMRRRVAGGRTVVGCKVGYANKAMWRALKLDTLVWAHMYDDTVSHAVAGRASLACGAMVAPKIEPEIVFKLSSAIARRRDANRRRCSRRVEWIALGFEIIDCVYADWKFQPADFVASYGLHAALVVGEPLRVTPAGIPALVEALAAFTVSLRKGGEVVAEGAGKNSLRSPALCLAELAAARTRQPGAAPLAAGDLISSGTLTESQPIGAGEQWSAEVAGLDLSATDARPGAVGGLGRTRFTSATTVCLSASVACQYNCEQ